MMIHKGEKPFECNICKKKFREKSNYNYHMKKHNPKIDKIFKNNSQIIVKSINNINFQILKNDKKKIDNNSTNNNTNENSIENNKDFINVKDCPNINDNDQKIN